MKLGTTGMNLYPTMKKKTTKCFSKFVNKTFIFKIRTKQFFAKKINCIQYGNCQEQQMKVTAFLNIF